MIRKVYDILLKEYGPQGWWPYTSEGGLKSLHYQGPPKTDKNRFEIMVGAILTQNTSWGNVEKAIFNLNRKKALCEKKIGNLSVSVIGELVRPSGYYNQKAKKLKILVDFIRDNRGIKSLFERDDLREVLLGVNGIGPETADSMVLYAAERPVFVIDAYTRRIFSRIGYRKDSYDDWQDLFMKSLDHDLDMFKEYHALIVRHAKEHCTSRPQCGGCPLGGVCKKCL